MKKLEEIEPQWNELNDKIKVYEEQIEAVILPAGEYHNCKIGFLPWLDEAETKLKDAKQKYTGPHDVDDLAKVIKEVKKHVEKHTPVFEDFKNKHDNVRKMVEEEEIVADVLSFKDEGDHVIERWEELQNDLSTLEGDNETLRDIVDELEAMVQVVEEPIEEVILNMSTDEIPDLFDLDQLDFFLNEKNDDLEKLEAVEPVIKRSESTRLNSSHTVISYAVFCLKKKINNKNNTYRKDNQYTHDILLSEYH